MLQAPQQPQRPYTAQEQRLWRIARARQSYYHEYIDYLREVAHRWYAPRPPAIVDAIMLLHRAMHCLYMMVNPLGLTGPRLARALNEADYCMLRAKNLLGV